jgi:hypothetical protein
MSDEQEELPERVLHPPVVLTPCNPRQLRTCRIQGFLTSYMLVFTA